MRFCAYKKEFTTLLAENPPLQSMNAFLYINRKLYKQRIIYTIMCDIAPRPDYPKVIGDDGSEVNIPSCEATIPRSGQTEVRSGMKKLWLEGMDVATFPTFFNRKLSENYIKHQTHIGYRRKNDFNEEY